MSSTRQQQSKLVFVVAVIVLALLLALPTSCLYLKALPHVQEVLRYSENTQFDAARLARNNSSDFAPPPLMNI
jgi:hypothetical protein